MTKKRYAIVRVDNKCLSDYENIKCPYDYKCAKCKFGKLKNYNYGDTKEQLIRKVAQALLKEKLEWYKKHLNIIPKNEIDEPLVRNLYEHCFNQATKIIEFLGVEK